MSHGDEFKFQRGATAHLEWNQGTEGGQKREHADDGMAVAQETLHLRGISAFRASTAIAALCMACRYSKSFTASR